MLPIGPTHGDRRVARHATAAKTETPGVLALRKCRGYCERVCAGAGKFEDSQVPTHIVGRDCWTGVGDGIPPQRHAIRGAERITLRGNAVADAGPPVAAYDVSRDLAVLKLPSARADSLTVSPALAEGQNAWGFGLGSCRVPGDAPIAVSWADRQHGVLRLKGSVPGAVPGGVLVAADGALVAGVTDDTSAVAVAAASDLLARARANIAAHSVRSPVDVAGAERHRDRASQQSAAACGGGQARG